MSWHRVLRRSRWDRERAVEMRAHLEHQIDDLIESGMSPDDARREAARRFGNVTAIREEIYDINSIAPLETAMRDARYALRLLRRTPIFSLTAIATLALAIGVNTAVFTLVDAVLLKPLPYVAPDRLALVSREVRANGVEDHSPAVDGRTWELLRDHATTVDRAVFSTWPTGVNLIVPGGSGSAGLARYVRQQRVSAGFFGVLGTVPTIGREFTAQEDRQGGPSAVILSAELWQGLFHSDPTVIGRPVVLRGEAYTVVGVMSEGFQSGVRADLWTPLRPSTAGEGSGENYRIVLRLRESATWPAAHAELASMGAELNRRRPSPDGVEAGLTLIPLQAGFAEELRTPLVMLWVAVAIVLIVACVNLAGLLLARAAGRRREIATRMALGSGRAAVVRQLLVESVVLALVGGACGLLVGQAALKALEWAARGAFEIWQPVALDARAAGVAAALSLLASALFGLAPAVQASRLDVQAGLLEGGTRAIAGGSSGWPRRVLVTAQVALGVVLLVGAGLLLRTFSHLRNLDPGFDTGSLVTAAVSLEDARYRTGDRVEQLFEQSLGRIRETAGIESAAVALGLPYERLLNLGFRHMDGPRAGEAASAMTSATYVSDNFFETLRIPLRAGRVFDPRDRRGTTAVVIVSDGFARRYFDGENPLGRHIRLAGTEREIVGVVGDVQVKPGWGDNGPLAAMPLAYLPVSQVSDGFLQLVHGWFEPTFVARSSMPAPAVADALRRALDQVDPLLPFAQVRSMSEVRAASLAQQRLLMSLLLGLAGVAVLLCAIGIHGLIATSVTERTREMGIRMALGATVGQALRTLAMPGIVLAGAGTAVGLVLASASADLIRHFVWGVSAKDPLTFAAVGATLLTVAVGASLVPALRIFRLDPATTLRHE